MVRDVLFAPVLVVYVAVLAAMFAYGLNFVYLTVASLRARQPRRPAEPPGVWPVVTVQLPLYNEMYVAGRLIDAVAAMDYPRDRFEVQVLDDSSDETADVVAAATERWRDAGVDIVHVRRGLRTGYKAGALAAGLACARGELVAIFDADFVPSPSFLRHAVSALAADPRLAFVQARWGHINRGSSLLTKLQALAIDGHFGIEQQIGRAHV